MSLDEYLNIGHVAIQVAEEAGSNFDEIFLRCQKYKRPRRSARPQIPPMVEVLQWHKYGDQDAAYTWLRGFLREQATALGQPSGNSCVTARSARNVLARRRSASGSLRADS